MSETDSLKRDGEARIARPDELAGGDPVFAQFAAWMAEAEAAEVNDANAMALATVDSTGLPNVRVVLLKGFDDAGFVFYTNLESAKGMELGVNPLAALNFHWKSLRRQVRIRGPIHLVDAGEADAYYATRPLGSRIGAWASRQSRPLESRDVLEAQVAACEVRFTDAAPPRPPHWSGYRLVPLEIEFWQDQLYRLHDRTVHRRPRPDAPWQSQRLYP